MMQLVRSDLNIDFLGKAPYAYALSGFLLLGSIFLWFYEGEDKYGIDYRGGTEIVARFHEDADSEVVRRAMTRAGFEDVNVQAFELGSREYSIRVGAAGGADQIQERVKGALKESFGEKFSIERTESVGPTIGAELRQQAILAVALSLITMLVYIGFRFEFAYALGAVVAVFHDVIVCVGFYLLCGRSISAATLASALTIVGYSVNDTIVIFDRVREVVRKGGGKRPLADILNESVNVMLSRTIITSLLTFFSSMALLVFGGGAIRDLSLFLVIGVITGSYSTIYIASPIALNYVNARKGKAKVA